MLCLLYNTPIVCLKKLYLLLVMSQDLLKKKFVATATATILISTREVSWLLSELLKRFKLFVWETRIWQEDLKSQIVTQAKVLLSINNVKWSNSKALSGKLMILNAAFFVHISILACSCWFNLKTILQPPNAFLLKQVSCVNVMETNNQQKSGRCQPGYSAKQYTRKYQLLIATRLVQLV